MVKIKYFESEALHILFENQKNNNTGTRALPLQKKKKKNLDPPLYYYYQT